MSALVAEGAVASVLPDAVANARTTARVTPAREVSEGVGGWPRRLVRVVPHTPLRVFVCPPGVTVRRAIGGGAATVDPFLLLDDARIPPGAGFPAHPHRGFETVSYLLEGSTTHEDFAGGKVGVDC